MNRFLHLTALAAILALAGCSNEETTSPKHKASHNSDAQYTGVPDTNSVATNDAALLTDTNATATNAATTNAPVETVANPFATPTPVPAATPRDIPYGTPVPGKTGFVTSPYSPSAGYVDVRGFPPGSEVKDPYSGKIFLVP